MKAAGAVPAGQMCPLHMINGPLLACGKVGTCAQQHLHSRRSWGLVMTMVGAWQH